MDVEALATLESQKNFCRELVSQVIDNECFILLSGDSGSGRTVVCESLVNETDSKLRAVFIPSNKDMQVQKLRELFFQQLLPDAGLDTSLNLADALKSVRIPHNQKVLVVVDDIDVVSGSFYNELLALHEDFLGQHRFAFVLVCHTLWAEEKASRYSGKGNVQLMSIPPLQIKEALILSRHIFALNNTMRIYRAISNKLPDALAAAKGNLSQVINITEKLMKEPTAPQATADKATKGKTATGKTKKSSSVGIFVTIVCIIIVLACLIPIFFGGNFFSDDDKNQTHANLPNDNALAIHDDALRYKDSQMVNDDGVLPQRVPQGIDAKTPEKETEHSVTLSGKELDKIEGGANGSGYPRRVEGSVNNTASQQVAVLRRADNFNHVNPSRGGSTAVDVPPPQQMAPSNYPQQAQQAQQVAPQRPQPVAPQQRPQSPEQLVAQNQQQQANVDRAYEQERQSLEKAAQDKLAADRKVAEQGRREAEAKAKKEAEALKAAAAAADKKAKEEKAKETAQQQPARAPLRAGQVINLADEQRAARAQQQARPAAPQASGKAVEAPISELNAADGNHFTVQIVSASNRNNIAAAASALTGKYWIVETRRNGKPWYVLVAGNYATREEAQAAARTIPASVSQGATPFAKRLSEVKADQAR